jgi:hypothetical protein
VKSGVRSGESVGGEQSVLVWCDRAVFVEAKVVRAGISNLDARCYRGALRHDNKHYSWLQEMVETTCTTPIGNVESRLPCG